MRDTSTRVFTLMCALVIVWVGVYWFYDPGEPPVTFGDRAGSGSVSEGALRPDPLAQLSPGTPGTETNPSAAGPAKKPLHLNNAPLRTKPDTAQTAAPTSRVIPPKFHEYVVQPGDTSLQAIAKKLLGDAKHWQAIASANKYVDPRKLVPGRTRLLIPDDPRNVEGLIVPTHEDVKPDVKTPAVPAEDPSHAPVVAPANEKPAFSEYIIQRQDTLSDIAQKVYGKSSLWRLIYEANRDLIPDPDHLKLGTTIRIPNNPG